MAERIEMLELKKQMQAASAPHVRGIGEILLYLGQQNEQIAELIEQDLANREMSIDVCGKALYDYAKKHQKGGSWACAVFEMDPNNPVIKLILDFYKIPSAWVEGVRAECADTSVEVLPMTHEEEPQSARQAVRDEMQKTVRQAEEKAKAAEGKLAKARNPLAMKVNLLFEDMQSMTSRLENALAALAQEQPETAEKFRTTIGQFMTLKGESMQ